MRRRKTRRSLLALACLGAVVAPSGCGGSGNGESAEQVAQAYVTARNQGDAAKVCDLYVEQLREGTGGVGLLPSGTQPKGKCEPFVSKQMAADRNKVRLTLVSVDESGGQATAMLTASANGKTSQTSIPLAREHGEWKVAGVPFFGGY